MPICLLPMAKGPPIVIDKVVVLVGRHPDCDVVLAHSLKVSRKHCCLVQTNEHYLIRDLGSLNGVWINNERIDREELIEIGDEIMIGDVVYVVQELKSATGDGTDRSSHSDASQDPMKETPYQVSAIEQSPNDQIGSDGSGPRSESPSSDASDEPIPLADPDASPENDPDD